jgi:hypothetical protein
MNVPIALPLSFQAFLLMGSLHASTVVPLQDALRDGRITLTATGTGGHMGEAIRVQVRNVSGQTVRTRIPAGWVFQSVKEDVQDLMVVREEEVTLASNATTTIACRAFCTQGPLRGPSVGEPYRAGGPGRPEAIALAQAVAAARYDDHLVRSAIWVISNGYPIAGMGAMDSSAADTLRMVVSRLSGQPPPRYTMHFVQEEGSVCSGRPASITRVFAVDAPAGAVLNAVVLNAAGNVVYVLDEQSLLEPGRHVRSYAVPVEEWPQGRYAIHAWTTNGAGVHRMPFVL